LLTNPHAHYPFGGGGGKWKIFRTPEPIRHARFSARNLCLSCRKEKREKMPVFELSGTFCWLERAHFFCFPCFFFVFPSQRVQSLANKIFYAGLICHIKSMSFAAATTQKAGAQRQRIINSQPRPLWHLTSPYPPIKRPQKSDHPPKTPTQNINKNPATKV